MGGRGWLRRSTRRTCRRGRTRGLTLTSTFHDHHHRRTAFKGRSWFLVLFRPEKQRAGLVWFGLRRSRHTHILALLGVFFPLTWFELGLRCSASVWAFACLRLASTRTGNLSTSWTDEGHGWDSNGRGWHLGPDGLELGLGLRPTSVVRRGEGGPSVLCGLAESIE